MAQKDDIENLLFTYLDVNANYGGYKRDLLFQNLTSMEEKIVICNKCTGIMFDAVVLDGKSYCSICSGATSAHQPVEQIRDSVNDLDSRCPLENRGCNWIGKLKDIQFHMLECPYLLLSCSLNCGKVLSRLKLNDHIMNDCVLREVPCEHCNESIKLKEMNAHQTQCLYIPSLCVQGCGEKVPQVDKAYHNEMFCTMTEILCPFAEWGCTIATKMKIKRIDLRQHMEENIFFHSTLTCNQLKLLTLQNKQLEEKSAVQNEQINVLNYEISRLNYLLVSHRTIWNIDQISYKSEQNLEELFGPVIYIHSQQLQLISYFSGSSLFVCMKLLSSDVSSGTPLLSTASEIITESSFFSPAKLLGLGTYISSSTDTEIIISDKSKTIKIKCELGVVNIVKQCMAWCMVDTVLELTEGNSTVLCPIGMDIWNNDDYIIQDELQLAISISSAK